MIRRAFLGLFGAMVAAPLAGAAPPSDDDAPVISETSGKPLKRVERWEADADGYGWVRVRMKQLKVGDRVRMDDHVGEFRVMQEPYFDAASKDYSCTAETWKDSQK